MNPNVTGNSLFNFKAPVQSIDNQNLTIQQDIFNFFCGYNVVYPEGDAFSAARIIFPNTTIEQIREVAHQYYCKCRINHDLRKIPKLPFNYTGRHWYVDDKIKYFGTFFQGVLHGEGFIVGNNYKLKASFSNNEMLTEYCRVELEFGNYRGSLNINNNSELTSGIGQIIYHGGLEEYKGETLAFLPSGKGIFYSKGKYRIDGTFEKGLPHGNCTYTFSNGSTFTGDFVENNCKEGIYKYKNSNISKLSFSQALIKANVILNAIILD